MVGKGPWMDSICLISTHVIHFMYIKHNTIPDSCSARVGSTPPKLFDSKRKSVSSNGTGMITTNTQILFLSSQSIVWIY